MAAYESGTRVLILPLAWGYTQETSDKMEKAIIAGHYVRETDHKEYGGNNVISPRGIVYNVRFNTWGGIFNVHESRVILDTSEE